MVALFPAEDGGAGVVAGFQHQALGGSAHCLYHFLRGADQALHLHPPTERQEAHGGASFGQVEKTIHPVITISMETISPKGCRRICHFVL